MKLQFKKTVELLGLLVVLKLIKVVIGYSETPTLVTMTGMESMVLFDYIINFITNPIFFVVCSLILIVTLIIKISKESKEIQKAYINLLSWSVFFTLFYFLIPLW
ncbi:hypothetical protein [Paenibacillus sp. FSL P4-0288]|uniref:hypothetical protein n=1 Tax=Paenibacillus sp. FSL P4-0288 TaxID=2921633 RepID=UPI0030F51675